MSREGGLVKNEAAVKVNGSAYSEWLSNPEVIMYGGAVAIHGDPFRDQILQIIKSMECFGAPLEVTSCNVCEIVWGPLATDFGIHRYWSLDEEGPLLPFFIKSYLEFLK